MRGIESKVLWIVTARSGSKSIPDKNIKKLGGKPLLAYRILTAIELSGKDQVWLSTDSVEYAEIGASFGATVPFLRPKDLSTDSASSMDVILHGMKHAEGLGLVFEYIGMLEPTSPFIDSETLKSALEFLAADTKAEAVVAVKHTHPNTFFIQNDAPYLDELAHRFNNSAGLRRQDFKDEITPSGGFYISKWDAFKRNKTFYTTKTLAFKVPKNAELEIDEPMDWLWAEFLISKGVTPIA
ncbi:acylneuraminate cytidylyltransferase family protein [Mucilaginibacter ximonensis]|uniref:Acylneuraminate cytidylyltransferase family protein n=1 Tax=Mucilaginibacter ximonensis TaxID=538021 RepID=A0ABW5YB96_9SPHI